ncbi:MAG TPA: TolC family protein, partial [Gemmatimonadales bacterium]|nr:TolC family protein [Gemmatimonadales bacterium]
MRKRALVPLALVAGLAACATAPGYRPAEVEVPPAFRESTVDTSRSPAELTPPRRAADTVVADTVTADSVPPATPAAAAARVGGAPADQSAYWRTLGDSTLDRLIAEVLHANLDVRSAAARVRGARAARTEAALDFVPTVTVAGGYTRQRLSSATFPIGGGGAFPDQDIWDAGFDASWELDLFGRVRRSVQAQGALVGAAS